jgi:hypothetical protein
VSYYVAVVLISSIALENIDVELLTLNAIASTAFAVVVKVGAVPPEKWKCEPIPSVLDPVPS